MLLAVPPEAIVHGPVHIGFDANAFPFAFLQ
jgi:hypothetical protein